jgi:hypothetical protein
MALNNLMGMFTNPKPMAPVQIDRMLFHFLAADALL